MHELSIVQGLCSELERVAAANKARRVHRLTIEVGALSNVVPDLLMQAFSVLREWEPLIQNAELTVREIPLTVSCRECGVDSELDEFVFHCPSCRSSQLSVVKGEELLLREVELEIEEEDENEPDPSRAAPGESAQVE